MEQASTHSRALKILLIIHGIVTLAAGIVLIATPAAIPRTVGITIEPPQFLICYLLGAMELGAAALSFCGAAVQDIKALRAISFSFIVMHFATAVVEVLAYTQGVGAAVLANVALRILMALLFAWYGLYKIPVQQKISAQ